MNKFKQGRTVWKSRGATRIAAGALAAALGIVGLAACGGGTSASAPSDTLSIAIPGDSPTSFELNLECTGYPTFQLAYEPLIRVTKDGGYEPGIAESWEYSNGNTVFTMKIRDDIKFADGTDVTRQSVLDTLNYYKSVPGLNDGYIKPWTIKAVGDDSVEISYAEPFIGIESILSDSGECNNGMIISAAGLADPEKLKTATFGAGPYVYDPTQSEPGDHYTYTPNPEYYDTSRQKWDKVVLRVIADQNTALNALASGQVQVNMTGGAQLAEQARAKGFDVTQSRSTAVTIMLWDRSGEVTEPIGDVRVRRAIALALDRESIAAAVGPDVVAQDQFTVEGYTGYDADLPSKYTYDVDEAKKLLAEAGYADGFPLTIEVNSDDPSATVAVNAAADQLGKIGIDVELKSLPNTSFFTDFAAKNYSAGAVSYGLYGALPNDAYRLYKLPFSAVWNPFGSTDPDIDKAYDALVGSSEADFESNATEFNEVITSKVWYVPIVTLPKFVFSKGIELGKPEPAGNFSVSDWAPKN
ncbi:MULTISPECIES: ABC transporter substrate-binding protein [unclassified Microbacterium]|uniref:ABC transporter substrate-binding protein n=1 Tax=unclassified Microbacterium TaxID=2609290 RepID=UPI003466A4C3